MTVGEGKIRVLSGGELVAVLAQAREERWTELALFGTELGSRFAESLVAEGWSKERVFSIGERQFSRSWLRALASLTSLTSLNLWGNQVGDDGARALASLTSLTSLNLTRNRVGDDGARALASLTSLTSLNLTNNRVGDDGARALTPLTNLNPLNLNYNPIGHNGARALASLTSLTSLNLNNNQVGDDGARALASLTSLTSLNLNNNQVGDDGARALASLTSLTSLDLDNNQVGDDGARALASLTSLTSLNLTNNQVTRLRPLLALPALASLYAFGNPAAGIPLELLGTSEYANCLPALTTYYRELDKGAAPNDVVKILLVGNGCVGKTTLAYCLAHRQPPPNPIQERTHGIVLEHIPLALPSGTQVDARTWDFGGQELYHATHRLFFHGNAIYLLLWAEETNEVPDETRHPVSYWLDMIRHLAADAPILLVKNQIDRSNKHGGPQDLEGRELGDVIPVPISAREYKNIGGLIGSLAEVVENARHRWGYLIPKSWQAVRDTLEHWRLPHADTDEPLRMIPRGRFEQLCIKHGIDAPGVLLTFLHDTGELFHRPGRFDDSIILDQNWFIDAIYRLFDRKSGTHARALERSGVLSGAESLLYWQDQSPEDRETYFDFMLQTGMAFELNRDHSKPFEERRIVVPALLPSADHPTLRPLLEHWDEPLPGKIWLRVEYPFLHRGHIESLIVALSRLSEERNWWREGIVVRDPQTDCRVFFQAGDHDRHLDIRLRHGRHGDALARIRGVLDKLLHHAPTRILTSEDGKTFVEATGSTFERFISPQPNHDPDHDRSHPAAPLPPKPIRIFISYAHEDEAYRKALEVRLKAIERQLPIEYWHDRHLLAGTQFSEEIFEQLAVTDVVLLLISPDFMASDYCYSEEMAEALRKYERNEGLPVPIIIRPESTWHDDAIGQYAALPRDGKPIHHWPNPDDAWDDISKGLQALITDLATRRGLIQP